MKKIKISNNANPNFIGAWNIGNKKLCDNIIDYFENNKSLQVKGESQSGVDINLKKTTDISISPKDLSLNSNIIFKEYISELFKCYKDYVDTWPFLKKINSVDIGKFVIVKYKVGDHFSNIHCERESLADSHRLFAWMTYLNDVENGGNTYFDNYDIKIKPECGKTLIWPAEWTHTHSAQTALSEKYIITGWLQFSLPGN